MKDEDFKRISNLLDEKLSDSQTRIITEIGDFVHENIIPQLAEKAEKSDIERLERKLDTFSAQVIDHDQVIKQIKSLPLIAHELKSKGI